MVVVVVVAVVAVVVICFVSVRVTTHGHSISGWMRVWRGGGRERPVFHDSVVVGGSISS